jgi:hypothetical protein
VIPSRVSLHLVCAPSLIVRCPLLSRAAPSCLPSCSPPTRTTRTTHATLRTSHCNPLLSIVCPASPLQIFRLPSLFPPSQLNATQPIFCLIFAVKFSHTSVGCGVSEFGDYFFTFTFPTSLFILLVSYYSVSPADSARFCEVHRSGNIFHPTSPRSWSD